MLMTAPRLTLTLQHRHVPVSKSESFRLSGQRGNDKPIVAPTILDISTNNRCIGPLFGNNGIIHNLSVLRAVYSDYEFRPRQDVRDGNCKERYPPGYVLEQQTIYLSSPLRVMVDGRPLTDTQLLHERGT
jgi:hypothetical protein